MHYLIWKVVHVLSVVIFLGNIITGLFWAARANKTKDFNHIAITFQSIIKSDRYFTIPGIIGIVISGIAASVDAGYPMLGTGWIFWPIVLFSLSGVFFSIYVGPLQRKISEFTANLDYSDENWKEYKTLYKRWEFWGFWATITPLAAMVIMILKPYLPGL